MYADGLGTAFEGPAHPYKENILKFPGKKTSIGEIPEIKATIAAEK